MADSVRVRVGIDVCYIVLTARAKLQPHSPDQAFHLLFSSRKLEDTAVTSEVRNARTLGHDAQENKSQ